MSDLCLSAALRFVGKRPTWDTSSFYNGERPCLPLAAYARIGAWASWQFVTKNRWVQVSPRVRRWKP